jgi:flagellar hook protein FlgE
MGLASALSTALTGLNAAETTIDVVGNNLANSNTVGFKASKASFATQFLQTLSLGSAPTTTSGGTNPRQLGLGTMVADITPNFTQGTIEISSNPTDLAIQGEGFFIVQGTSGERLYTRNGIFKLNSENQMVTITGNRLLGFGVNDQYQIQQTHLVPLTIPLGAAAVARPTSTAFLEGTLSPTGALANAARTIQTGVLSNGSITYPEGSVTTVAATSPPIATLPAPVVTGPGNVDQGTYFYKFVYADGTVESGATQGVASGATPQVSVGVGGGTVAFTDIPADDKYSHVQVYRTEVGHSADDEKYYYVGQVSTDYFNWSGATPTAINAVGGAMDVGDYYYRIEYSNAAWPADADGPLSRTYDSVQATVNPGQNAVDLTGLSTGGYNFARIYRTTRDPGSNQDSYYYLGEIAAGTTVFNDRTSDAALGPVLTHTLSFSDTTTNADAIGPTSRILDSRSSISGNYSYYVTYYNRTTGVESRPSLMTGQGITVEPGRVHLYDFPASTNSLQWPADQSETRIYRNLATDSSTFYYVTSVSQVDGNFSYTDAKPDAVISDLEALGPGGERLHWTINLEGPPITQSTLLRDVIRRDGSTYQRVFDYAPGTTVTLEFSGQKGDRTQSMKTFTIDDTTNIISLYTFMEQAMGIQKPPGPDPDHPIPNDANLNRSPGGWVQDGRLKFTSNNGMDNAVGIGLSGMQLVTPQGTKTVNMPFATQVEARGASAVTDFIAYDSLGIPIAVRITAVLESRTSTNTTYRWFADSPDNDPDAGNQIAVGTGLITFDGEGNFTTSTNSTVSVGRSHVSSRSPLEFNLDFSQLSGLAAENNTLACSRQDGSSAGVLTSFIVGEDGRIRGVFSNGITRDLGQVRLARFSNVSGLEQKGENMFSAGVNSGLPVEGNPNEQGIGSIISGAQELSNTDIGGNLIDLILASTMYRGNTRVITTVQQMLDELLALRR